MKINAEHSAPHAGAQQRRVGDNACPTCGHGLTHGEISAMQFFEAMARHVALKALLDEVDAQRREAAHRAICTAEAAEIDW